INNEIARSRVPPDQIFRAPGGRHAVEGRIPRFQVPVRLGREVPAGGRFEIRPAQHGPRLGRHGGARTSGGEGHDSPTMPSDINADRREGWVKVKIYLDLGGSRGQEAADVGDRGIWSTTVADMERRGGVREAQGPGHRIVEEPRVDVGGVEDDSATSGFLDGHGERRTHQYAVSR